jgi:hypothetical protein
LYFVRDKKVVGVFVRFFVRLQRQHMNQSTGSVCWSRKASLHLGGYLRCPSWSLVASPPVRAHCGIQVGPKGEPGAPTGSAPPPSPASVGGPETAAGKEGRPCITLNVKFATFKGMNGNNFKLEQLHSCCRWTVASPVTSGAVVVTVRCAYEPDQFQLHSALSITFRSL